MSLRKQIKDKLATDLLDIKIAKGYITDIKKVHTKFVELQDVMDFPSIACYTLGEQLQYLNESNIYHTADYILVGYFQVPEGGDFEIVAENFYDDIIKRFNSKMTLNELPLESLFFSTFEPYPSDEGKGVVVLQMTITYITE